MTVAPFSLHVYNAWQLLAWSQRAGWHSGNLVDLYLGDTRFQTVSWLSQPLQANIRVLALFDQLGSTFFVSVPPDVISLQLRTPKVFYV
jgi:hypothetical protein